MDIDMELKVESFETKIDRVLRLWAEQKTKAEQADVLLKECEELEEKMYENLEEARQLSANKYDRFLQTFQTKEE